MGVGCTYLVRGCLAIPLISVSYSSTLLLLYKNHCFWDRQNKKTNFMNKLIFVIPASVLSFSFESRQNYQRG